MSPLPLGKKRDWNYFLGAGWRFCKTKNKIIIEIYMYEARFEFPEEWRGNLRRQKPSVAEVWIFSGTTQRRSG